MSENFPARTIKGSGVYLTPEGIELFALNAEAHYIWLYAMMMANTGWIFRKSFVMTKYIGCGERKWKAAIRFLISVGLLEIAIVRGKNGKITGKEYVFRDLENRIDPQNPNKKTRVEQVVQKTSQKTHSKPLEPTEINHLTESDILPCTVECNYLFTSSREREGFTPPREQKMDQYEIEQQRNRFMQHFTGINTFQTFDDSPDKNRKYAAVYHNDMSRLDEANFYGAGIFLTINETNGKGRKKTDITRVRAIFVDLDGEPLEPVLAYNPHMVVETSAGKYHAYWFVKDFPLDAFTDTQKRLAEMFNADKSVNDLSRVLRIPGYWHQKGEAFLSRIILEGYEEPLTYAEVVHKFPPAPVKQWSKPRETAFDANSDYKGQYGTSKGDRNNGLARFVGGMKKRMKPWGFMESEAYKWGKGCSPPLDDREIDQVLRSIGRYAQ